MKIVFTGGGSGGHVYPTIALIKHLRETDPNVDVLYIGKKGAFEERICQTEKVPFMAIDVTYLYRKKLHKNVGTLRRFFKAKKEVKQKLLEFQPDVVIGTGGYVSGPVLSAAKSLGIRILIHEQNSVPGLTNRWLSRYADHVAVSFPESQPYFKKTKTVVTGNPRGFQVANGPKADKRLLGLDPNKKLLLIFFGSQGGKYVNQKIADLLPLIDEISNCETIFVTGPNHYDDIIKQYKPLKLKQTRIVSYLDQMPSYLTVADLVICRAGATTIAELTALGIPAIYIPSPHVTGDHQTKNAQIITDHEAGVLVKEKAFNREAFYRLILDLIQDDTRRKKMGEQAKKLANIDGFEQFIQLIYH